MAKVIHCRHVAKDTQPGDNAAGDRAEIGVMSEGLARMHIRDMHLYESGAIGYLCQGIPQGH